MTIELYSLATPNGHKIAIALEEMGLPYNAHTVNIMKGEQFEPKFLAISPNNKIPAIVDTETGISVFESGSILVYLAEKTGKFLPGTDQLAKRTEVLNWLFWQMGGLGPFSGQMGHFHKYAKSNVSDESQLTYGKERYLKETQRLWGVLEKQFEKHGGEFVCGDELSIADFAIYPWLTCVDWGYNLKDHFTQFTLVNKYIERMKQRPSVQKGEKVTPFE